MKHQCNSKTKYAYLTDNTYTFIHVDDFASSSNENIKCPLKCRHGHELVKSRSSNSFKHKYKHDVHNTPMTSWHLEWQSNFPITEYDFPKLGLGTSQVKGRRTDVWLPGHNVVVEFQHSKIEAREVNARIADYAIHNQRVIWIIHGNDSIKLTRLDHCGRIYLEFVEFDNWKYTSFLKCDTIFIDIDEYLYKVYPKHIRNDMIDVDPPISKVDFIKTMLLSKPSDGNAKNLVSEDMYPPPQSTLYIKQQGAGNGKTYGLIQMLQHPDFEHYQCFIIVTKQHSAKYVIFNEFKNQVENGQLQNITNITCSDFGKKYRISYTKENSKNSIVCQIVIGTIDSLMFSIGNQCKQNTSKEINKFQGLVNSIVDGYLENNGVSMVRYSGVHFKLNKELCLICDETQDLDPSYAKAIIQIMRNRYIDAYIVGDKLQSIVHNENAFTYLERNEFSYVNKVMYEATNICHRFFYPDLVNFVNTIVPFEKYALPCVEPFQNIDINSREDIDANDENHDGGDDKHVVIFEGQNIYGGDADNRTINKEVDVIMKQYIKEAEIYEYKPSDFLIITPFTTKNPLVNALETAIDIYWAKRMDNDVYERFANFHKSEEGAPINLSESENATRIVSIHTSKGDGRNIVFVIGLDEQSLLKFSGENGNLVYDSLIHVALTRMKKKLFIRFVNNDDDIAQRLKNYVYENGLEVNFKSTLTMKRILKYQDIVDRCKTNAHFETLCTAFQECELGNHNVREKPSEQDGRVTSMLVLLYMKIINRERSTNYLYSIDKKRVKKQIQKVLSSIGNAPFYKVETWKDFYKHLKNNSDNKHSFSSNNKKEPCLCMLKISEKADYTRYFNIICAFIESITDKLASRDHIKYLCPFECFILTYMLETFGEGIYAEITVNDLYNIVDKYSKSFATSPSNGDHVECLCCQYFGNCQNNNLNRSDSLESRMLRVYETFLNKHPSVNWLINHKINLCGKNESYNIWKKFKLIGYDDHNVFIIYIKPQLNELNLNEILVDSMYDTYLIQSLGLDSCVDIKPNDQYSKRTNDSEKFANKNVITIVFSLDNDDYKSFKWSDMYMYSNIFAENIRKKLVEKYTVESKYLYSYFKYWKHYYSSGCFAHQSHAPLKIIGSIILECKNNKSFKYLPPFVIELFEYIESDILNRKNGSYSINGMELLDIYTNKTHFESTLLHIIHDSVEKYI